MGRRAAEHMGLASASWMVPTHNRATRGGASRRGRVALPEQNPPLGQCINVRRIHRGRLVDVIAANVLPSKIVGQNQNDIRRGGSLFSARHRPEGKEKWHNERKTPAKWELHAYNHVIAHQPKKWLIPSITWEI